MSDTNHEKFRQLTVGELEKYYFQVFPREDDYNLWQDFMWELLREAFQDDTLKGRSNSEKIREAYGRYRAKYLGNPKTDSIVENIAKQTEEKLIHKLRSEGLV